MSHTTNPLTLSHIMLLGVDCVKNQLPHIIIYLSNSQNLFSYSKYDTLKYYKIILSKYYLYYK